MAQGRPHTPGIKRRKVGDNADRRRRCPPPSSLRLAFREREDDRYVLAGCTAGAQRGAGRGAAGGAVGGAIIGLLTNGDILGGAAVGAAAGAAGGATAGYISDKQRESPSPAR